VKPAASGTPGLRRFRGALLRWYRRNRRDLPWRATRDPYAIWVSEIMLQQTQVATVVPYYLRFVERFPDVRALADCGTERVLAAWSGLGYYRRARALHAAARVVVERHGGRVPDDPVALRALPGIGRYTAGAIASVAYGREEPVLDGNVRRLLSRFSATTGEHERELWDVSRELVRGASPGDLNQALMELGALVCTPRRPHCPACPLRSGCAALASGEPETFPRPRPARSPVKVRVAVAVVRRADRVLLERPLDRSPLRGEWDLPAVEIADAADPRVELPAAMRRRHGLTLEVGRASRTARHAILHRRLTLQAYECSVARGGAARRDDLRWIRAESLDEAAVSGATRKLLDPRSGRGRAAASAEVPKTSRGASCRATRTTLPR